MTREPAMRVDRTRTRQETARTFLLGLRAMTDSGAFIHALTMKKADIEGAVRAREDRMARAAEKGDDAKKKRKSKGPGRPRKHKQKPTETDVEYKRRLDRQRKQKQRAQARQNKET